MSTATIDVSIVLVSWNTRDLLLACLDSIPDAVGAQRADVWVVDNGSADGSVTAVRAWRPASAELPVYIIENQHNAGFAAANNQAIVASTGRYVLLLNSDTVARPGSIERLVRFADERPGAGLVGAMLLNPDGSYQGSFADFPSLHSELLSASSLGPLLFGRWYPNYGPGQAQATRQVDYIQGACMLARRAAVEQVGLLDEAYFMYNEETDWCLRMRRADWETWYLPAARIVHYGGQSTKQVRRTMVQALYRSKVRFFRKHYGPLPAAILRAGFVAVLRAKWLGLALLAARRNSDGHKGGARIGPPIRWSDLQSQARAD
jgi:N-acetylglucosaminyl-diphospho-decaprenol L-rhamnosyltransferase